MAIKILINAIRIGGIGQLWPGSSYDDEREAPLVAQVEAAGGLLWSSDDALVAAAATRALDVRSRAGSPAEAESIMQSAVQASQSASIGGANTVDSGGSATVARGAHETFVYPPLAGVALATVEESAADGIITGQPTHARTVDVVFAAGWEGGDITIDGLAPDGSEQQEVYTSPGAGGGTVNGAKAFLTITAVTNGTLGGTTDLATVQTGAQLAVGAPVDEFLFVAVDGAREAFGASSSANGTFSTTTVLDGTQFVEVWYASPVAVPAHTHTLS